MKNKYFILTGLIIFIWTHAQAQTCLPGGITFSTQSQIDSFTINYPGCTDILGDVTIQSNPSTDIVNLNLLNGLSSIGGNLTITNNTHLTNVTGLFYVASIGGDLIITMNPALTNLEGLQNVSSVAGVVEISGNNSLVTLLGMQNIDPTSISDLIIESSGSLSICQLENICTYLSIPTNTASISGNATGCSSRIEVETACLQSCLSNGLVITTQTQIDNFSINYPGCSQVIGTVYITSYPGNDITNLNGLSGVNSIGGDLWVYNDSALIDLTGFNNITTITGALVINNNPNLINLNGLDSLTSIGDYIEITSNSSLNSLMALSSVTSIVTYIELSNNDALPSLAGLDNINLSEATFLQLQSSNSLSYCSLNNICDYLSIPSNFAIISGNANGCNSRIEVDSICNFGMAVEELHEQESFMCIFPNPFQGYLNIQLLTPEGYDYVLRIDNMLGQPIYTQKMNGKLTSVNLFEYKSGNVYFVHILDNNGQIVDTKKIIKQ